MIITTEQLITIVPTVSEKIVETLVRSFNEFSPKYKLDTPRRVSMFLPNTAHESGSFKFVREIWGPTPTQKRYEGRLDLGNTQAGDGKRFMGRGYMQLTGRDVYAAFSEYAFGDDRLLRTPELLEAPVIAMESAMWFWTMYKNLNTYADKPDTWRINVNKLVIDPKTKEEKRVKTPVGPFDYVCYRINGKHPANGLKERQQYYANAKKVLVV